MDQGRHRAAPGHGDRRIEALLGGLDGDQRACVTAPPGPVVVHAGPGAGKTRVLTARVAFRVLEGSADPRRSAVVTFTRRAAAELQQRLRALGVDGVQATTVHGLARRLLERRWADRGDARRAVVGDPRRLLADALVDLPVDEQAAGEEIEWAAARCVGPADYLAALAASNHQPPGDPELLAEAYRRYERRKARRGVVDFSDLLRLATEALHDPVFGPAARWRCAHLLIDEAQDLDLAQWRLLASLAHPGGDLFLVGDADQAIYGWNGADAGFLLDFERAFVGATSFRLGRNYRSAPAIVATARAVLRGAQGHDRSPALATHGGEGGLSPGGPGEVSVCAAEDEEEEARMVTAAVRRALGEGVGLSQLAVLARTNAALRPTERALKEGGVRVRSRFDILGQPSVRRALTSLERCPRHLGTEACRSELRGIVAELLPHAEGEGSGGDREALSALLGLVGEWCEEVPGARLGDLRPWLSGVLRQRRGDVGRGPPAVDLVTFHRAKGLQWRRVFVVGVHDGLVPLASSGDVAEERRLLYVALTRAEEAVQCFWRRHDAAGRTLDPSPFFSGVTLSSVPAVGEDQASQRWAQLRAEVERARATSLWRPVKVPATRGA